METGLLVRREFMKKSLLLDFAEKKDSVLKSNIEEMGFTVFSLLASSLISPDDLPAMKNYIVFHSYNEVEFNSNFDSLFASSLLNNTFSENMDVSILGDGEHFDNAITEGM